MNAQRINATLIISVHKNIRALKCILDALRYQTCQAFEIIISEDGETNELADFVAKLGSVEQRVRHLTQEDKGFRKTRALNRAVAAAESPIIIFIDGDCVPHPRFIEGHLSESALRRFCTGRRIELGPVCSEQLIGDITYLLRWSRKVGLLLDFPNFHLDGVKHLEAAIYSRLLHHARNKKNMKIVGCNFSLYKVDIERINGFDERFSSIGTGEDTDLEWRLISSGCSSRDVKHITPLFHLFHERVWPVDSPNEELLADSKKGSFWRCNAGLNLHLLPSIEENKTAKMKK